MKEKIIGSLITKLNQTPIINVTVPLSCLHLREISIHGWPEPYVRQKSLLVREVMGENLSSHTGSLKWMDGWEIPLGHGTSLKKRYILPTIKAQNFCQTHVKLPTKVQSSFCWKFPYWSLMFNALNLTANAFKHNSKGEAIKMLRNQPYPCKQN